MPIRPPPADPQMLQGRAGPGRQLWQTGPAWVTAATRRLFPHLAQGFQLRGSRCQQFWQRGCPPSLRRAAGLTIPHRPQGSDRALLRHPPQRRSPSTGTPSCRCRPATGAGWLDHGGGARAGKRADEPQDAGDRGAGALAGEQPRLACHGGCDAAPPVRAGRRLPQCPEDRFRAERGLQLRHQGEQGAGRIAGVGPSGAAGHCAVPAIRARFGRRAPMPAASAAPPTAAFPGRRAAPARGDGLDEVVHRAVQNVEQCHEDLQAQPLGPLGDQTVDLARGQGDAAVGQQRDDVGGGEHPAVRHDLAQVPAVVEPGGHLRPRLLTRRRMPGPAPCSGQCS